MPAAEAARPIGLDASKDLFETLTFHAHVALAVSGGSDSTALMWLASRWAKTLSHPPKISVLTVDHGLRPEAAGECARVANWARALGRDAHILTWAGARPASGLQARARDMRYGLMRDWCLVHKATLLVTAHTLEDQAETLLMRLARGSGIRGLSGMRPDDAGPVLLERPLLKTSRAELRATLSAAGHSWIEDPSNADERFERVRLRKALPLLAELGLTPAAVARSATRLERALEPIEELCRGFLDQHVEVRPEGFALIDLARFRKIDDEIAIQVLERLLWRLGGGGEPPRLMAVEALHQWLRRGETLDHDDFGLNQSKVMNVIDSNMLERDSREKPVPTFSHPALARTLAGCRIAQRKRHLLIGREAGRISKVPVAILPGESILWDNRFQVSVAAAGRACAIVPALGLKVTRTPHIPAFVQDSLPVLLAEGEIAAIPALGALRQSVPTGLQAAVEFQKIGL